MTISDQPEGQGMDQKITGRPGLSKDVFSGYMIGSIFDKVVSPAHRQASIEEVDESIRSIVISLAEGFYRRDKDDGRSLLLLGAVGCGKTSLMAVLFREYLLAASGKIAHRVNLAGGEALSNGEAFLIPGQGVGLTVSEAPFWWGGHAKLIKGLRDNFYDYGADEVIPAYMRRPGTIFFIDDYGTTYMDDKGVNQMLEYEFFDWAWRNRVKVIMSTNLTEKELELMRKDASSELGRMRTVDRIMDNKWMARLTIGSGSRR